VVGAKAQRPGVVTGQVEQPTADLQRRQDEEAAGRLWLGLLCGVEQAQGRVLGDVVALLPAADTGANPDYSHLRLIEMSEQL
jgi:hypothetical protein